jgi:cell division protein ZapA (FtsZ GTPase activity inhibitor)
MPELILEIGGRSFEVACEEGQEASLTRAAKLLDTEAQRVDDAIGRSTEKRMLLLAGLMLADTMTGLEDQLRDMEGRLRQAEERVRLTDAKAAMLSANALKLETAAAHKTPEHEVQRLRKEHEAALTLLSKTLDEVSALGRSAAAGS